MERVRTARWSRSFGGRRSFQFEIGRALDMAAEFKVDPEGQRRIVMRGVPGWLEPMWGSDGDYFYARRPEGAWRAPIPRSFAGNGPVWLYQRFEDEMGGVGFLGGTHIGSAIVGRGGWLRGRGETAPIEAADRDDSACPANRGFDVDADVVGSAWGAVVEDCDARLVVSGGDYFGEPPAFSMEGKWLMAIDASGYKVAYPIEGHPSFLRALAEGRLCLRFEGRWLRGFDAPVPSLSR